MPPDALLTGIRLELAREPSGTTLWGLIVTTVGIAAAMIGVFVDFLTYLQGFDASTVSLYRCPRSPPMEHMNRMTFADRYPDATVIVSSRCTAVLSDNAATASPAPAIRPTQGRSNGAGRQPAVCVTARWGGEQPEANEAIRRNDELDSAGPTGEPPMEWRSPDPRRAGSLRR